MTRLRRWWAARVLRRMGYPPEQASTLARVAVGLDVPARLCGPPTVHEGQVLHVPRWAYDLMLENLAAAGLPATHEQLVAEAERSVGATGITVYGDEPPRPPW